MVDRYAVPNAGWIVDLQWADEDSLYISDLFSGVTEVSLEEGLPEESRLVPIAEDVGLTNIPFFAVDGEMVAVAQPGRLLWGQKGKNFQGVGPKGIGAYQDIDAQDGDLVILGTPGERFHEEAPGGIVWTTELSDGLGEWEVLYEDERVARDWSLFLSKGHAPGSLRILKSGDILIAPNSIPGVLLISSSGGVEERWSPEDLWGRSAGESGEADNSGSSLKDALAQGKTIDEVLDIDGTPGIIVRGTKDKGPRWQLGVLDSQIRWYDIPIEDPTSVSRLRGDMSEKGRLALVPVARNTASPVKQQAIVIVEIPE